MTLGLHVHMIKRTNTNIHDLIIYEFIVLKCHILSCISVLAGALIHIQYTVRGVVRQCSTVITSVILCFELCS
jgi:hypothetical protein